MLSDQAHIEAVHEIVKLDREVDALNAKINVRKNVLKNVAQEKFQHNNYYSCPNLLILCCGSRPWGEKSPPLHKLSCDLDVNLYDCPVTLVTICQPSLFL